MTEAQSPRPGCCWRGRQQTQRLYTMYTVCTQCIQWPLLNCLIMLTFWVMTEPQTRLALTRKTAYTKIVHNVRGEFKFKRDYVNKTRMVKVRKKFISYDFCTWSPPMLKHILFWFSHRRLAAAKALMAMVLIARSKLLLNVSWVRGMSAGCSFTFKKRKNSCRRVYKHLDDEFEQPLTSSCFVGCSAHVLSWNESQGLTGEKAAYWPNGWLDRKEY
jgi:hypothetical protein